VATTIGDLIKTSRNQLAMGVLKTLFTADQVLPKLRFEPTAGESFSYNREKALPTIGFVSPSHSSIPESTATFDRVTVPLRLLIGDADVYMFGDSQGEQNQKAIQIEKKIRAAGRTLGQKALIGGYTTSATLSPTIAGTAYASAGPNQDSDRHGPGAIRFTVANGYSYRAPGDVAYGPAVAVPGANGVITLYSDNPSRYISLTITVASVPVATVESVVTFASSTDEPDGLLTLMPSSQVRDASGANGDALSFAILDSLINEIVKTAGDLAFVCNSKLMIKVLELLRSAGGNTAAFMALPGINGPVPVYRGIPFLVSDWIPNTESKGSGTTLSSMLLVDFGPGGFYAPCGQNAGSVMADIDPSKAPLLGFKIREVGELEAKEAIRTRFSWYGAFALGSNLSAGRARQLVTA
jgi:hypothetical protein